MSETKPDLKDTFARIQELSGQKGQYKSLDSLIDELIDQLNDFVQQATETGMKRKAEEAISGLLNAKEEDVLQVKTAELEGRGKGATVSRDRAYARLLDSAIAAVESQIAAFL